MMKDCAQGQPEFGILTNIEHSVYDCLRGNDMYSSIFCGAVAGVCAKTVIAPAERIKMSFQVTHEPFTYSQAYKRASQVIKNNGVLALWKGHSTTIIRVTPYAGLSYAFHDYAENQFKEYLNTEQLPFIHKFLAGSIAGAGSTLLTYPLDVLRVRLALGGSWQASVRQGGLFQGLVPTLLGIIPYSGIAWCVKQTMVEFFVKVEKRDPVILESLLINAIAGLCGQFITYPLDVVRRRMQIAKAVEIGGPVPTFRRTLYTLLKTEGWRGMTKGFSLNIIKGPITLSISFTTYDFMRRRLKRHHDVDDSR
jgi:solute carrier family 25 protein 42